ncbi:MAG TPA: GAF domain-containing protein [Abditibacteriaceae bacterium]|jgi:signal transduction histidine kinase
MSHSPDSPTSSSEFFSHSSPQPANPTPDSSSGDLSSGVAHGTLADAALPSAAFSPDDFDVELSQTSLAEADELLKSTLDEAMNAVGGNRAFLALVDTLSGELVLRFTAGPGWTEDIRRLRVSMHAFVGKDVEMPTTATEAARRAVTGMRQGITRHVVVNGRRYWTGDVSKDPYYIGFFDDVQSEVAVPITARGGGTIGVVNVESPDPDAFDEGHANLLSVLARRIAVIVAMAEHQLREEALIAIGKDLNSSADVEVLMQDVVQQATKILRADDCSLFLFDEESETLQLEASHGPLGEQAGRSNARYALGEGLTGWVAQHGTTIRVGDPRTDPRWKGLFMEAPAGELASVMAVPVRLHRGILGVLRVVRHRKGSLYFLPQEFTQADEDVLVTLAGQLAVAVDRTRLLGRILHSERMAAWGEMSARSAHMIGNAVFGVKGHLNELKHWFSQYERENMVEDEGDDRRAKFSDADDLMENVQRGIYRLEGILSEFRDFVLATQLHATPYDINQILRTVTAESFPKHSNIDLVLNLSPSLPPTLADEAKLKRAFAELIENSIDFQPDGGQLTIRTGIAEADTIHELTRGNARNSLDGKVLQIEFIDRGPGLSEQDRQRVFTPFYTRKAKGMGLGLSIVKGIIEAHGGVIREVGDVDLAKHGTYNAPAAGAHFVVLLPAQREEAKETK